MINRSVVIKTTSVLAVATMMQWFNFFIAAVAAATVWPSVFFPQRTLGLTLSIVAYAVTFVTRPVGALFLGMIGDSFGRKASNVLALILMALGSLGIAATPSYAKINILAPTLVIVFRLLQGLGIGGQWGSAVSLVSELTANSKRRTFWTSLVQAGLPLGMALAIFGTILLIEISGRTFLTFGWRIMFIIGVLFIVLSSIIIRNVSESPFLTKKQDFHLLQSISNLKKYKKDLLKLVFAEVYEVGTSSIVIIPFSVTFLSLSSLSVTDSLASVGIADLLAATTIIIVGFLSGKVNKKRLFLLLSTGLSAIMVSYPYPLLLKSHALIFVIIAQSSLFSFLEMGYSVLGAFFAEHFPTEFRSTGVNLSYQLSAAIVGSINIIAITIILPLVNGLTNALIYITSIAALLCTISFCTLLTSLKETSGLPI